MPSSTKSTIFLSYRRADSAMDTGRIYDRLVEHFGRDSVFKDVDSIDLGDDFHERIDEEVAKADLFLVVMGSNWLGVDAATGDRKIDADNDFVRIEVSSALTRQIPIIPLFVDGVTTTPDSAELPEDLTRLSRRNGLAVRPDPDFHQDVDRLIRGIEKQLDRQRGSRSPTFVVSASALEPLQEFRDTLKIGGEGPVMVVLPSGVFEMGDAHGGEEERPVHEVRIDRPFAMSKYPVTFEQYDTFVNATDGEPPEDEGWGRGRRPAINVSFDAACAYAAWLVEETGKPYRLPSESEWEYAARAGTATPWFFGDQETNLSQYAWYASNSGKQSQKVGEKSANPWGLHDVYGNINEWVQDCWHGNYTNAPNDGSAWLEEDNDDGVQRVIRGGAWHYHPRALRSATRRVAERDVRDGGIGFRLAENIL